MRPSVRRPQLVLATLAVLASALTAASSESALAASGEPARQANAAAPVARTAAAGLASSSATGASDLANLGARGWKVHSATGVTRSGARISRPGYHARGWLRVSNDGAGAPGTEVERPAAERAEPGQSSSPPTCTSASVTQPRSARSRCRGSPCRGGGGRASARQRSGRAAQLVVNGVVGAAAVWVNGRKVAGAATVTGAYTRFAFDITRLLRPRQEHGRDRGQAERPAQDVHAGRRGLEPDPAGQQHRDPVPGPASGGRAARRRQRARDRAQRARPDQLRADRQGRHHQPRGRPRTGTFTATITPPATAGRRSRSAAGHRPTARHADGHAGTRPGSPRCRSAGRCCGGRTSWAASRSTRSRRRFPRTARR